MAQDIVQRLPEIQKQMAIRFLGQFHLPRLFIGGEFPVKRLQHDRAGFAQMFRRPNPMISLRPKQPDDVAHGADRFRRNALNSVGRPTEMPFA